MADPMAPTIAAPVSGRGWITHSSGSHYSSSGVRIAAHPGRIAAHRSGAAAARATAEATGPFRPGWGYYGSVQPVLGLGLELLGLGLGLGLGALLVDVVVGRTVGRHERLRLYRQRGRLRDSVDVGVRRGRYAVVKTDVSPEEAQVYLDGKYIGVGRRLRRHPRLPLPRGRHVPPRVQAPELPDVRDRSRRLARPAGPRRAGAQARARQERARRVPAGEQGDAARARLHEGRRRCDRPGRAARRRRLERPRASAGAARSGP